MSSAKLPALLARASSRRGFWTDPLGFLTRARALHGDTLVISQGSGIFSRSANCPGAVAVFGVKNQREVLSDTELYGVPKSAAHWLRLPNNLITLNRSLHSMTGDEHAVQKRYLVELLRGRGIEAVHDAARTTIDKVTKGWREGSDLGLLSTMRNLTLHVSSRILFGEQYLDYWELTSLLQAYFHLRREASSPIGVDKGESIERLLAMGKSLDTALRKYVRACRGRKGRHSGVLAALATSEPATRGFLSEDAIVGHSNILFVSSTEPIAVALTWTLLILSQLPELRYELRKELGATLGVASSPIASQVARSDLLERVIKESLRLLPPNAFMVRTTTRAARMGRVRLPPGCEIVLCPFLSHRDSEVFESPDHFCPSRWRAWSPSPFAYFPFGAGGHSCIGANLATQLIKETLAILLTRHDLLLAGDQQVDWRLHILFMAAGDPRVNVSSPSASVRAPAGKLKGPVARLLILNDRKSKKD